MSQISSVLLDILPDGGAQNFNLLHFEDLLLHRFVEETGFHITHETEDIPVPVVGQLIRLSDLVVVPISGVFVRLRPTSVFALGLDLTGSGQLPRSHECLDGCPELSRV